MSDRIRLDQRVALVTGAGSPEGIGFATARILAERGARVAIVSTTERIHERALEVGDAAAGFVCDLRYPDAVDQMLNDVERRLGEIDVLVNNAGMTTVNEEMKSKPFTELGEGAFERELAITLLTTYYVTRGVTPGMVQRRYGRIVNVSSVTGSHVSYPAQAPYSAAKAGVDGLTRALAVDLGPSGITVNSVAPGWIATASLSPMERRAGQHTPLGRAGTPDEVGELIAWLASDAASYVTGQSIVIDGGNTVQEVKGG
ncbi:MAG TPA: SDR family NAD(P)-dependent oxidoreductase [Thermoleophilaceae bacterium]